MSCGFLDGLGEGVGDVVAFGLTTFPWGVAVWTMSDGFLDGLGDGTGDGAAVTCGFITFPWVVAVIGSIAPPAPPAPQPTQSAPIAKVSASMSERDSILPDSISDEVAALRSRNR